MKYTTGQGENLNARWIGPTPRRYIRMHPIARLRPVQKKKTRHERGWLLFAILLTLALTYLGWSTVAYVFFLMQGM